MLSPEITEIENFCIETVKFYVYLHKTPDGRVFYVGKGSKKRAFELSPSRRNKYHNNIVKKYGKDKIEIQLIPCAYETEAWMLERALIVAHGQDSKLANFTNGGEGAAGRGLTDKQSAALAKGRLKGKRGHRLTDNQKKVLLSFVRSPEHRERTRALGLSHRGKKHPRTIKIKCKHCDCNTVVASPQALFCSKACGQRFYRSVNAD